jgi:hypothetical protein
MHIRSGSFVTFVNLAVALALSALFTAPGTLVAQAQKASAPKPAAAMPSSKAAVSDDITTPAVATIVGSGTIGTVPVFTASHTIHNSLITESGNGINVAGTLNAVAISGNGSELTLVPAVQLGGLPPSAFAQVGISNTFTADQTINGNLNLTGYINGTLFLQGNLTDTNGEQGSNVLGGFEGTAASGGNSIAPGVIGATIGGGGGIYDSSLYPKPAVHKRPQLRGNLPNLPGVRSPFSGQLGRQGGADQAVSAESAEEQTPTPVLTIAPNVVALYGNWATIAGGLGNTAAAAFASIGGGDSNNASDVYSTVGGGYYNTASGNQDGNGSATVAGGNSNSAIADYSTIAGGNGNTVTGGGGPLLAGLH